jgi:hypothetical protein
MCCTHRMMMGGSSGSRLSLSYKLLRTAQKRKKNERSFVRSFPCILIIVSTMQREAHGARKKEKKKYDNL